MYRLTAEPGGAVMAIVTSALPGPRLLVIT
jgi:hypothetical protein